VEEDLVDIRIFFGAHFEVRQAFKLLFYLFSLRPGHFDIVLVIAFVAHKHDVVCAGLRTILLVVLERAHKLLQRKRVCQVKYRDGTLAVAEVLLCQGGEHFLAGSVPDLQL